MAQEILQTMGLRSFMPMVIACPGCGHTTSTVFQELAQDIQSHIRTRMPVWQKAYPGFETLQLAVMGCIVNGPGDRNTPISASPCPAPARSRRHRSILTARR